MELLTVVGIIALLIGILLPSISGARKQARKAASAAVIKAIGDGLQMFHNDFGGYPASTHSNDPVADYAGGSNADLSGAHWLARAMVGHDFQGVDAEGLCLDSSTVFPPDPGAMAALSGKDRKTTYLDDKPFARDTDTKFNQSGSPATGRPVIIDTFGYPIIYYRANARARTPIDRASSAVYNHEDNADITGKDCDTCSQLGWDFAGVGYPEAGTTTYPCHALGQFGDPAESHDPPQVVTGKTFVDYIHSHKAHEMGGILKPVNAETFILISSGADGIFGTDDDVNNFSGAL